jgi:ankyrin repeat protein
VGLLLANDGVDPDSKDNNGRTLLSWATTRYWNNVVVELLLVKEGVNPDSKDNDGPTPLSWAAGKWHGVLRGVEAVLVELLLAKDGVDPNSKDEWGRTPLSHAADSGHETVVKLLLEKAAELESKNADGHGLQIRGVIRW